MMDQFDINALKEAWADFPEDSEYMPATLQCELSLAFGHINDIEITIYAADSDLIDVYEFLCLVGQREDWQPGDLYPVGEQRQGDEDSEALSYRSIIAAELREKLTDEVLSMFSMDALVYKLLQPESATAIWLQYYFWDYKQFVLQYPGTYRYVCVRYVY